MKVGEVDEYYSFDSVFDAKHAKISKHDPEHTPKDAYKQPTPIVH